MNKEEKTRKTLEELLRRENEVTAGRLAEAAGVSRSYATEIMFKVANERPYELEVVQDKYTSEPKIKYQ